ncbi:MAG: hypothetical protein ABIG11_01525 [bacterium]
MTAKKAAHAEAKTSVTEKSGKDAMTGRYVFDKKLGKVVKVSDRIPGLKKSGSSGDSGPCESGSCPSMGGMPGGCGMGGMGGCGMGGMGGCGGMGGMGGGEF